MFSPCTNFFLLVFTPSLFPLKLIGGFASLWSPQWVLSSSLTSLSPTWYTYKVIKKNATHRRLVFQLVVMLQLFFHPTDDTLLTWRWFICIFRISLLSDEGWCAPRGNTGMKGNLMIRWVSHGGRKFMLLLFLLWWQLYEWCRQNRCSYDKKKEWTKYLKFSSTTSSVNFVKRVLCSISYRARFHPHENEQLALILSPF